MTVETMMMMMMIPMLVPHILHDGEGAVKQRVRGQEHKVPALNTDQRVDS
jgi:hypothetical protein